MEYGLEDASGTWLQSQGVSVVCVCKNHTFQFRCGRLKSTPLLQGSLTSSSGPTQLPRLPRSFWAARPEEAPP